MSLSQSRYKIVVQTNVGQLKDQGIRIASRCLWEPNTDNYASTSYSNVSKEIQYLSYCSLRIYFHLLEILSNILIIYIYIRVYVCMFCITLYLHNFTCLFISIDCAYMDIRLI